MTALAVMAGGALGALARYLLAGQVTRIVGVGFPWGTLVVNVLGALVMGVLVEMMALHWSVSQAMRAFLTVGVLGGFTTFSAFSLEMANLLERGAYGPAFLYALGSVVLCVAFVFLGMFVVRNFS